MDFLQSQILARAKSIKLFCDGDETFVLGEYKAWNRACLEAGKKLPPSDFKKSKSKRQGT